MKSTVETLSPTRVRFDIEVPYSDLEKFVQDAYKVLAEKVSIPGFRKGKVPASMIDQRVGRGAVLDEAINSALPEFYTQAALEHQVGVIGRPSVDIKEYVDKDKLVFTAEVDVRPEIKLPNFSKITINVDDVVVTEADISEQIDSLRARFGTLNTVERAAAKGDFATIDLLATVDGKELEGGSANDISYEVGSERMIPGLDEALIGLKAGENKTFTSTLFSEDGDQSGDVSVTVKAVKERELPPLDDAFAKLASEFDSLEELRKDFVTRLERVKKMEQGAQARDRLMEKLLAELDIPVPENIIEAEVQSHLESENRIDDDAHRKEVSDSARQSIKSEFLLDTIIKEENVQITEIELTEYLVRTSARYGMAPDAFAQELQKQGQIQQLVGEVTRAKALANVLSRVTVKDASGNTVDLEALAPKPAASAEETK